MLKEENYDHVIDLHHNLRSARIKLALKRPSTSFSKLNFEKWLIVNFKINRLSPKHIVDRYFETVEGLNCRNDQKGLDFYIPAQKHVHVANQFGEEFNVYAAFVIGAAHETKCMTADQISELSRKLNMPVVLLGGKKEIPKANLIMDQLKSPYVKNACGQFDIFESASILNQSSVIITHDTGMMHIAAALKKPQIVVWGNTIPEFGMTPYYGNENVVWHSFEITGLKCRPCSKLGYEKCPKGHFKCMLDHNLAAIVERAKLHLEN
jgi:ADP-heptose:LPS heptosyltransferase